MSLVDDVRVVASDKTRGKEDILDELSEAQSEIEAWIDALENDKDEATDRER